MKTGILFDLDGTLLNTLEDLTDATNYALSVYGCPPRTLQEIRSFVGNGAQQQIRLALPEKDAPELSAVLSTYKAYYREHCQVKTRPYPQIPEALADLSKDFTLGIVSNKPDAMVQLLCAQHFPGLYAKGETGDWPKKPAPDMVFRAMHAMGVERCIYVGDSEVDILTATNAGIPCLAVSWGFRDREILEEAGAKWICDHVADMSEILRKMAK